ncbi:MAG: (2Fe-2S) ferredoxin domain-containing protein [Pseudomonadales bacterium]|nr:(2Fe-2S) ferredoxin domain-containing protein [Pseudomonadales bacterium]
MATAQSRILVCTQQCPPGHAHGSGGDAAALTLLQAVVDEIDRRRLWPSVAVEFKGCPSPCNQGPALLLYPEGVLYNGVTPADLPAIIANHFPLPTSPGTEHPPLPAVAKRPADGAALRAATDAALTEAAASLATDAGATERRLEQAARADPGALAVHFARYKFLFHRNRLAEAEAATRDGLAAAAAQGGFAADWRALSRAAAPWSPAAGPARFYLFSLKALAFIRLRRGDPEQSRTLLDKLAELDPDDQVGAEVIRALHRGAIDAA